MQPYTPLEWCYFQIQTWGLLFTMPHENAVLFCIEWLYQKKNAGNVNHSVSSEHKFILRNCTMHLECQSLKISVQLRNFSNYKYQFCLLQLPIPYCVSLIMLTRSSHVFSNFLQGNIFKLSNFSWVMWKNMSIINFDIKISKIWKKKWINQTGSLNFLLTRVEYRHQVKDFKLFSKI